MKAQEIHKAIREIFLTDTDLFNLFGGRLSNTRLPTGFPRPYITADINHGNEELYTGGQIVDYSVILNIYTTEGYDASLILEKIGDILDLVQILNVAGAKKISMVSTSGTDKIDPNIDLGQDILVCSLSWNLKLFEPNRLSPPNGE